MAIPDEQVGLHGELNTAIAQALGEPERVAILRALAEAASPLSVDALAASSGLDASSLANPLADLVAVGIIISTEELGKSYQFAPTHLARTLRAMLRSTIASAMLPADSGTLDTILDQMADGVALFDAAGRLVRLNPAGARITRRTLRQGEAMDERLARFQMRQVNGEFMSIEDSPSGRALRGEVVTHMECLIDGQHGPETFLRYSAAPLREEDGTIQGAIVIFEDITEERRLSQEEARQRSLAAAMIEHTFGGMALFDISDAFRCVLHNDNFLRMMGSDMLVRGNIVGMPLDDMFAGETLARVRAIFEQVRATGDAYFNNEFTATLPPEERRHWYRWRLTPLRDDDGKITGLLNVVIEITELVAAREASRRHANELTAIIEAMPEGVMLVGHNGHVVLTNGAAERILGHPLSADTPVNHYREVFHTYSADGRRLESHEIPMVRALKGETVVSEEVVYQRPDGSRIDLLTSTAPVDLDDSGQSDGAVAIFQDISRIKELERQRDDFLGIAAHELRTPLATILATLQAFMRRMRQHPDGQAASGQTISPEALSSGMERMYRQAQRLNKLVSDLLDSTRIRTGKLIYDLEPCDLVPVVRDAVTGQIAANPGRTITLKVPGRPVTVMGDAFRLSQVVDNLVANALKYSTDDMPVAVSLAIDDDMASLHVTDKGIGIPPEHIEHLFERFYRVPGIDVQSGAGVGLGLGLHITRSVVERHGGGIDVRSARGKGSTFSVRVPLLQQSDQSAE